MTDELAIQQQTKPAIWPYALGGAVVGGAAGTLAANKGYGITSKYSSYEDILNESEDTFKRNVEKGGDNKGAWETAQSAAKKVKDAEAEYDRLVEEVKNAKSTASIPEDAQVKKDLKKAQSDYDAALREKMGEKKVVRNGNMTGEIPARNPEWRMGATDAAKYDTMYNDYITAKQAYDAQPDIVAKKGEISTRKTNLESAYEDIINKAETEMQAKPKKFPTLAKFLDDSKGADAIEKAVNDNIKVELNNEELIRLGGGYNRILPTDPGAHGDFETFEVIKKDGSRGYVEIQTSHTMSWKKTEYQKLLAAKQDAAEKMLRTNIENYIELKGKLDKYPETFKPSNKSLVRQAGLTRDNAGKIVDLETNIATYRTQSTQMKLDKKLLEELKLTTTGERRGITFSTEVQDILTRYGVSSPKEAHEMTTARLVLVKQYDAGKKEIEDGIAGIFKKDGVLTDLNKELGRLESSTPEARALKQAETKIRGKFKDFMPRESVKTTVAAMTEEEAKAALEGTDVAKKLETAKKALEEEAAKSGKTLTPEELAKALEVKGLSSKEAYVSKVKESAKGEIEAVLGKLKHTSGWKTGLLAAGALGLAGLGIGAAARKD